jgi:hypothetical protein
VAENQMASGNSVVQILGKPHRVHRCFYKLPVHEISRSKNTGRFKGIESPGVGTVQTKREGLRQRLPSVCDRIVAAQFRPGESRAESRAEPEIV